MSRFASFMPEMETLHTGHFAEAFWCAEPLEEREPCVGHAGHFTISI